MKILIDTHIFLWLLFNPEKISRKQLDILEQQENEVFLSNISLWEISLKYSIGRLSLEGVTPNELPTLAQEMDINFLPPDAKIASSFHQLPKLKNKDLFDRMIIWQAIGGNYHLISNDGSFSEYQIFGLKLI